MPPRSDARPRGTPKNRGFDQLLFSERSITWKRGRILTEAGLRMSDGVGARRWAPSWLRRSRGSSSRSSSNDSSSPAVPDGVIGADLIGRFVPEIDFDPRSLSFWTPSDFRSRGYSAVPLDREGWLAYINVSLRLRIHDDFKVGLCGLRPAIGPRASRPYAALPTVPLSGNS